MPEITKISHGLTIGDLKYGNARPGVVEATLKPGETMEQALDELDERLTSWHKKRYPHLYQEQETGSSLADYMTKSAASIPVISKDKEPEDKRIATLIADIYSCIKLSELESYQRLAKTKPELQAAYDQQYQQLIKSW